MPWERVIRNCVVLPCVTRVDPCSDEVLLAGALRAVTFLIGLAFASSSLLFIIVSWDAGFISGTCDATK